MSQILYTSALILTLILSAIITGCDFKISPVEIADESDTAATVDTFPIFREDIRPEIYLISDEFRGGHLFALRLHVPPKYQQLDYSYTTVDIDSDLHSLKVDSIDVDTVYYANNYHYYLHIRDTLQFKEGESVSIVIGNPYFGFIRKEVTIPTEPDIFSITRKSNLNSSFNDTVIIDFNKGSGTSSILLTEFVAKVYSQELRFRRSRSISSSPCTLTFADLTDTVLSYPDLVDSATSYSSLTFSNLTELNEVYISLRSDIEDTIPEFYNSSFIYSSNTSRKYQVPKRN